MRTNWSGHNWEGDVGERKIVAIERGQIEEMKTAREWTFERERRFERDIKFSNCYLFNYVIVLISLKYDNWLKEKN
jgi:hypothetical protein